MQQNNGFHWQCWTKEARHCEIAVQYLDEMQNQAWVMEVRVLLTFWEAIRDLEGGRPLGFW